MDSDLLERRRGKVRNVEIVGETVRFKTSNGSLKIIIIIIIMNYQRSYARNTFLLYPFPQLANQKQRIDQTAAVDDQS